MIFDTFEVIQTKDRVHRVYLLMKESNSQHDSKKLLHQLTSFTDVVELSTAVRISPQPAGRHSRAARVLIWVQVVPLVKQQIAARVCHWCSVEPRPPRATRVTVFCRRAAQIAPSGAR